MFYLVEYLNDAIKVLETSNYRRVLEQDVNYFKDDVFILTQQQYDEQELKKRVEAVSDDWKTFYGFNKPEEDNE